MDFSQYTSKSVQEILEKLESSENGLSESEAKKRQKIYGLNEIKAKEVGIFDILIRQFKSPFFYLLFIAAIIAFLISEKINAFLILCFVLINVLLGFFQEAKAERAILLLKRYIPSKIRVLRGGEEKIINKNFLVPGDIVLVSLGNIVPADLRILKNENFLVDESVLTGESGPVGKIIEPMPKETKPSTKANYGAGLVPHRPALLEKGGTGAGEIFEAKNILFAGTSVISGKAKGIVVATGRKTVLGQITKLVSGISRESAYEKNIIGFSKIILRIVVITIILIFLANLMLKRTANVFDFLIFCLALIVSIIPEALPLVVTFALSRGALKLAKKKVVVKRLSAVEDLGDIEVLCADKTGTLTENKLILEKIVSQDKDRCLLYGLLSSSFIKEKIESARNPFDLALYEKSSSKIKKTLPEFEKISEIPFDPIRARNSVLLQDKNGNKILIVKGAPEIVLGLCSKFKNGWIKSKIKKEFVQDGKDGKRILALAFREFDKLNYGEEDEKNLTFLGYFSFIDPLKKTTIPALELAKKLGVQIKIITGDSFEVAGAVAKNIGLISDPQKEVILGKDLDSLSAEKLTETCEKFNVFARVSPAAKFKIIEALQKKFEVGFMGEGINDVPALKIANVAVVVESADDVAREASDIILLKKDLRIIVDGIKEGRNIFANITKYIKCALASNFGNFYSIAVISLFVNFLPMLPVQILLGNLLSDFPLIAVTTDSVDPEELRKPKSYQISYFIGLIICLALISTAFDFLFFGIFYGILYRNQPAILQTLWFIESILTEVALIFAIRTRHSFLKTKRPSLALITLAIIDSLFIVLLPFSGWGQRFLQFARPPITAVLIVFSLVLSYFIISEIVKLIYFQVKSSPNSNVESRQGT